jgi:hypothetical protein
MFDQNLIIGLIVLAVLVMAVYAYAPKFRSMISGMEGFQDAAKKNGSGSKMVIKAPNGSNAQAVSEAPHQGKLDLQVPGVAKVPAPAAPAGKEGFADYASVGDAMAPVPMAGARKPQGCYPREQLNPMELLPNDVNSQWAAVNPTGAGDIQGKNFLSAGALVGVNTVGQSLRNANYQLRAEPPNPQLQVGPWNQSTNEPDLMRRPLE